MLSKNEEVEEYEEKIRTKNIIKPFKKCHIDKFTYIDNRFIFLGRSITTKVNLITKNNEIELHICNKDKTIIELIETNEMENFKIEHIYNNDEDISLYNVSFDYFNIKYKVSFFE